MANFKNAIKKVLVNEGGYVNDPKDSGGETKFGITKRTYPNVDIKNLTIAEAEAIYKKDYWGKIKGNDIASDDVAYEILDAAVNMGVRTSSKLAQITIGAYPDGIIGQKTLKELNGADTELFVTKFKLSKVARYIYLAKKYSKNRKFLFGWISRVLGA
jgi:lysozyme family protein